MTKAIEEYAKEFATKQTGGEYHTGFEGVIWQESYETYIKIATEQRKIGIDKACDAYCKQCNIDTNECRRMHIVCPGLRNFKKAMEEEQ